MLVPRSAQDGPKTHSWLQVGGLEAILAPSWGVLGPSCLQAGGSGDHLGSKLGALRGGLGETWVLPGCPGGQVGSKLGLT